jgi:transcriptional regulator of NAD metabolism
MRGSGGEARRQNILAILRRTGGPVAGAELAQSLRVSRQVVVQDVALLRARGHRILATPHGYLALEGGARVSTSIAARHTGLVELEDEMATVVALGGTVVDITVEHPLYGEIRGMLMVRSHDDVRAFVARLRESGAAPLSSLTRGVHLHTLEAESDAALAQIVRALREKGYLVEGESGGENSLAPRDSP